MPITQLQTRNLLSLSIVVAHAELHSLGISLKKSKKNNYLRRRKPVNIISCLVHGYFFVIRT